MSCILATSGLQNSYQCLLYIAQSATRTLLGTRQNVVQKILSCFAAILPGYTSPPNLKYLPPPLVHVVSFPGLQPFQLGTLWICVGYLSVAKQITSQNHCDDDIMSVMSHIASLLYQYIPLLKLCTLRSYLSLLLT